MATRKSNKKIGKTDPKKLNWLRNVQEKRNRQLEGTGVFCNLRPNKSKKACKECLDYNECFHLEWERDLLNKEASKKEANRRKRKQDNPKRMIDPGLEQSAEELFDIFEEDDTDTDPNTANFPCKKMSFACPDKEKCHLGKDCPW